MDFNYYQFSLITGGIIALISGAVLYIKNRKQKENKIWFWTNIASAIWSFGYFTMISTNNKELAWFSNWIMHYAAILIPVLFYHFSISLVKKDKEKIYKQLLYVFYFISLFFLVFNHTKIFVQDVFPKYIFNYVCDAGPLYIYFTLFFWSTIIISTIILLYQYNLSTGSKKIQLKFILFSELGFLGGGNVFFLTFNLDFPPYFLILYSIYPIIITYAIIKHRLMGIKFIANQLYVYGLLALFSYIFFYITTFVEKNLWGSVYNINSITIGGIFAILFSILLVPILNKIRKTGDKFFYKGQNPRKIIKDLAIKLNNTINLEELLIKINTEINKIINTKKLSIILINPKSNKFCRKISLNYLNLKKIKKSINLVKRNSSSIIYDELKNNKIKNELNELNIKVIFPLFANNNLIGLIILKNKNKNKYYTEEDIEFINELIPQISISIENALLYKRLSNFNLKLKKEVDRKTSALKKSQIEKLNHISRFAEIGRQSSGILHDLSNPLSSLSLNIELLQRQNKIKKLTAEELSENLGDATNIIVKISKLINISKKQIQTKEIIKEFDPNEEIKDIIKIFKHKANTYKIKIGLDLSADIKIAGNPIKFSQILSNLISNALDSFRNLERKNKKIEIESSLKRKKLIIEIKDNGAGIKKQHLNKIFNPLFTTKKQTGTGIGLSLTKSIIEKDFNGEIKVISNWGRGSRFVVRLGLSS